VALRRDRDEHLDAPVDDRAGGRRLDDREPTPVDTTAHARLKLTLRQGEVDAKLYAARLDEDQEPIGGHGEGAGRQQDIETRGVRIEPYLYRRRRVLRHCSA